MHWTIFMIGQLAYVALAPLFPPEKRKYDYIYLVMNLAFLVLVIWRSDSHPLLPDSIIWWLTFCIYTPVLVTFIKRNAQARKIG
ncbi:hypothetical protein [Paenibacillus bovis]|uniref:Uncharacterized protein n=1 Tax=Paenibacillus bovis TaxID=1616788 RepID=A0A172ZC89_9BACL|nr:hypothetical protein [Paenibacillus bovis]ANF94780.1 hypothetical protein AR543_01185 [Paenibacillus bovis]